MDFVINKTLQPRYTPSDSVIVVALLNFQDFMIYEN